MTDGPRPTAIAGAPLRLRITGASDLADAWRAIRAWCATVVDTDAQVARFVLAAAGVLRWLISHGGGQLELAVDAIDDARAMQPRLRLDASAGRPPPAALAPTDLAPLVDDCEFDANGGVVQRIRLSARCSVHAGPLATADDSDHALALALLDDWCAREESLRHIGRELEDTNRGVVALYAELDDQADRLRRADEAKGRFLSNISHEFRTPLNAIGALARLLLDRVDGPLSVEQDKQVRFIRKAADDLREMVDDLLDLAKIDAGRIDLQLGPVQLEELWSALRGMMRPLVSSPRVELLLDPPPAVPLVTDEAKLAQILRNLISNALKYTENGTVRLHAQPVGGELAIAVTDTGIGIDEAHRDAIFEEFVQVDSALQRRIKGTGLGLPLCRRLAQLLGGRLELESRPGEGSTFRLLLPLDASRVVATNQASVRSPS